MSRSASTAQATLSAMRRRNHLVRLRTVLPIILMEVRLPARSPQTLWSLKWRSRRRRRSRPIGVARRSSSAVEMAAIARCPLASRRSDRVVLPLRPVRWVRVPSRPETAALVLLSNKVRMVDLPRRPRRTEPAVHRRVRLLWQRWRTLRMRSEKNDPGEIVSFVFFVHSDSDSGNYFDT